MSDKIDIWEWTYADREEFRKEGGSRQVIIENYEEFWQNLYDDPISAELAINHAIEAARACGEVRWELHLRHWRIQNWVRQSQVRRMLSEAIDLLSLAVDERVKDVPQRICAYHDVVECYVEIDPAGYYQEIKENSEHILSQLPKRYPCADCARSNLARAAAAAGHTEEAEHWLAEHESKRHDDLRPDMLSGRGATYVRMRQWDNAERLYREAYKMAQEKEDSTRALSALIGLARARLGKSDLEGAQQILPHIRQNARYEGGSEMVARLLEVEGYAAEQFKALPAAVDYFTRSAKVNDELGCAREAAEIALHAAELAREHQLPDPEEALNIAAHAVGELPPTSQDLYQRLAALGRKPLEPASVEVEQSAETPEQLHEQENRKELANLEELLQGHLRNGLYQGITSALFRLGVWHDSHNQARAALDYFIWSAALERLRHFSSEERESALNALKHLSKKMPEGSVTAALRAAESSPPTQLLPMLTDLPVDQWQWTLQAIATEVLGKPVVEPVPAGKDARVRFEEWLDHYVSMTILLVRFRDQVDQAKEAKIETWARMMEDLLQLQADNATHETPESQQGFEEFSSLVHGLAALARGSALDEVQQNIAGSFKPLIDQIRHLAQKPVWQHPGNWPLDFMVEQVAQKAVKALRRHDDFRAKRLANLAFRYELMTIDLRQHDELNAIANFFSALTALLQNDGQSLPDDASELEEPYTSILTAVMQSGLEAEPPDEDA